MSVATRCPLYNGSFKLMASSVYRYCELITHAKVRERSGSDESPLPNMHKAALNNLGCM